MKSLQTSRILNVRPIGRWQFDRPLAGAESQARGEDKYIRCVTSERKACAALITIAPASNVFPANAMVMYNEQKK